MINFSVSHSHEEILSENFIIYDKEFMFFEDVRKVGRLVLLYLIDPRRKELDAKVDKVFVDEENAVFIKVQMLLLC